MDEQSHRPADGPQQLGDVLSRLAALRGYGRIGAQRQLSRLWRDAAGPEISERTRVLGLRNGVLLVGVESSALLSELASFHRHHLLEAVRRSGREFAVTDLKFRLRGDLIERQ